MVCQGNALFNQKLVGEISKYLQWKKAKSCKDKELHSSIFIQSNEKSLQKEFCGSECPFRFICTLTKKGVY